MSTLTKRSLIAALIALGAAPVFAQSSPYASGAEIGAAYLAAHPTDLAALRAEIAPEGVSDAAIASLRSRIADDFRNRRTFAYRGWIMACTEAQLFALLLSA